MLVPRWLRTAFLQRELVEFLFSFPLKSVGSGSGRVRRGRKRKGKEHFWTRKLRDKRCSGHAIEVADSVLAFIKFRRQSQKFLFLKSIYPGFSLEFSNFQIKICVQFIQSV